MDFDVLESKVVPFSLTEEAVRERFLDYVIEGENTPIDIACNAVITTIKKALYPVRCFDVTYSAHWSATSFWEHKEPYTEYESKTIYIDHYGKEHSSPGFDMFHNGQVIGSSSSAGKDKRPWRPQQKTIPITKYKTVIDNVEQTQGSIEDQSFQPIITYENPAEASLAQWVVGFPIKGNTINSTDKLLENSVIMPLFETDGFAQKTAESKVQDIACAQCEGEVPGDRYRDLSVSNFNTRCSMEIVLLPVFHIQYEYQGQQFECWRSGISNGNFFYCIKPQDTNIAAENERAANEIKLQKKQWLKFAAISFIGMPFALLIGFALFITSPIFGTLTFIAGIVFEVLFIKKFLTTHQSVKNLKQSQSDYQTQLIEKRRTIANIVKDPNINEEEKRKAVEDVLHKM